MGRAAGVAVRGLLAVLRRGAAGPRRASLRKGIALKGPIAGAFKGPSPSEHRLGPLQTLHRPIDMRRYSPDEEVDFCIVGVGAAGGVLLQRLAKAGFRVVGFDAGPFWDTDRDWVSDEAGSHKL